VTTGRQLDREIADHQERDRLRVRVQRLLDTWQPIVGARVSAFRIKKMRAFATLNVRARRLWISQQLGAMGPADLEYVVVHELAHLRVADLARAEGVDPGVGSGHDALFYAILDRCLPSWRRRHAHLRSGDGVVARDLPGMKR
jgi:predicted metal-dependent hydrolase